MRKTLKVLGVIFLILLAQILFFVGSESRSKHLAENVCGEIKLGISSIELSELAKDKGARIWINENNEIAMVSVEFPISGAYYCQIQLNNGSVVGIGKIERKPGG